MASEALHAEKAATQRDRMSFGELLAWLREWKREQWPQCRLPRPAGTAPFAEPLYRSAHAALYQCKLLRPRQQEQPLSLEVPRSRA